MIFWNRNKKFKFWISPNEIEENMREYSTSTTVGWHKFFSIIFNIAVAVATYFVFGFNIIAFAVAFIVTDVLLVTIGWFGCYLFPYLKTRGLGLLGTQKRIENLTRKRDKLKEIVRNGEYYSYERKLEIDDDVYILENCIEIEQEYLDAENKKIEEQKIKEDKRTNKDFNNKLDYLHNCKDKLKFYINEKNISELKPVKIALNKLIKTLEERPMGITMIPMTLYIYLDELQLISEKICGLSDNYSNKYSKDIEKVSGLLRANIAELIDKINKYDMDDIEVSLSVLLKELEENEISDEEVSKLIPDAPTVVVKRNKKYNRTTKKEN